MCIDVFYRTQAEHDRRLAVLRSFAASTPCRFYQAAVPRPSRELTHLEWRVIRAMRGRARAGAEELGELVGVSGRTVKRAQERLVEEGAIDVVPLVDPSRIPHFIPVVLAFHFDAGPSSEAARRVQAALEDRLWTDWIPPDGEAGNFDVVAYASSTGEIGELRDRALGVPGVRSVDILLPAGGRLNAEWLNEAIDARIQATDPGVSRSATVPP